jgi:hypothetical protein
MTLAGLVTAQSGRRQAGKRVSSWLAEGRRVARLHFDNPNLRRMQFWMQRLADLEIYQPVDGMTMR